MCPDFPKLESLSHIAQSILCLYMKQDCKKRSHSTKWKFISVRFVIKFYLLNGTRFDM